MLHYSRVEILKKKTTLLVIYGPSVGDNPDFFNICRLVQQFDNSHCIIASDWNCPIDVRLDVRNYNVLVNGLRTQQRLEEIMTQLEIFEAAREFYPEKQMYSWCF